MATKNTVVRCVISTSLGDQSFNDSANAGITELQNAGYDAKVVECNNDSNLFEQNLRSAADEAGEGGMVIAVGSELDMVGTVAADYPDTKFVWCDNVLERSATTLPAYPTTERRFLPGRLDCRQDD
ncbi:MAG: BMP family ABC transporter substrate-binding protein [Clostridia bacterium]